MLDFTHVDSIILNALKEDMPFGDVTTDSIVGEDLKSRAVFIAKEEGIIAGMDVAGRVFALLDPGTEYKKNVDDGARVKYGDVLAEISGSTRSLLKGERTALNFLQRLSGIATMTAMYCEKVKGLPVKITDTRKTTPGLRLLEKYAVRVGGGCNHRYSLSDGILIKDNHIKAAGSIKKAVELARLNAPHTSSIEVETESIEQVKEALECGADIIMLDNMGLDKIAEAVKLINKRAVIEVSGNVRPDNVYQIASMGVDIISAGALTHSVRALDISMKFV